MGAVADCQIIISCAHNIAFCAVSVIAGKEISVHRHGYFFACSRLQQLCFPHSDKLNRRFFHMVFLFIITIWCLRIELHNISSRNISGIGHGHFCLIGIGFRIIFYLIQLLLKGCIGKSVTESKAHLIRIVPCIASTGAFRRICISCF